MAKAIPADQSVLSAVSLNDELTEKLDDDFDKDTFSLLKKILSVHARYNADKVIYSPRFEFPDGRRTFSVQDLTNDDFVLLNQMDLNKLPPILGLRIADILWTEKKDYRKALIAINYSHDLYNALFDKERWFDCFPFIAHAIGLAARIGAKVRDTYLQEIHDKVVELNGSDPSFLSLRLIELLISQKWKSFEYIIPVLDEIISNTDTKEKKIIEAYKLKSKILYKQGETSSAMESNRQLAKYLGNL